MNLFFIEFEFICGQGEFFIFEWSWFLFVCNFGFIGKLGFSGGLWLFRFYGGVFMSGL